MIASVGHHTDRTLVDDVAAVSCSTPTHAAEEAVPEHCDEARARMRDAARRLEGHGRRAVISRARALALKPAVRVGGVAPHDALDECEAADDLPDALVISRGGGAVNDLAWLNDFDLAPILVT